ncbi:MAG: glycosyltransferase, partial [Spirochaetaceae bacterium]
MILGELPVSVCIPAHNEDNTIAATVESILAQRGVRIDEVIVCANGCTDATVGVV